MVLSLVFIFLFVLSCSMLLFFFFAFFVPALRLRYDSVEELLSAEEFSNPEDERVQTVARAEPRAGRFARVDAVAADMDVDWRGVKSCAFFRDAMGSPVGSDGFPACIGYGDCARACPQEAIVVRDGLAVVTDGCDGCGLCVGSCPVNLVSLVPERPSAENPRLRFWSRLHGIVSG